MQVAPPPPVAAIARPVAFHDTECFPNYWLLKLRPKGSTHVYSFPLYEGQSFDAHTAARVQLLFDAYCVVSFNGLNYDVPMITAALMGYTPAQLKQLNDTIIPQQIPGQPKVKGPKPWELGLPDWRPSDHIDVMQVIPGAGGQKYKAGIIHYKTMRDLPYPPDTWLTPEQIANVAEYCENDLGQLEALFDAVQPQLKLRESIGKRYGLDLRSKSDAQMAEAVLKRRCELATGRKLYKPEIDYNFKFRFDVPEYIGYTLPQLQHALALVRKAVFGVTPAGNVAMPPELEDLTIVIGTSVYKLGIGGLHSQEKRTVHIADDYYCLRDNDVASYYPSLILNSGAWPEALGAAFLEEYAAIKDERLACKALSKRLEKEGFKGTVEWEEASTGDSGGKIMINGTFGKTLSGFSILFAPKMGIQTTVSGQLSLLMLIEWHELYGIQVVSANTDGIVIKCPRHLVHVSEALIAEWQKRTGLEMETVEYLAVYSKDVNNYVAVKAKYDSDRKVWLRESAGVKRKGEYAPTSLIMKKAPDVEICADAVADYLEKGVPVLYTISACRDIRKFVTIQNIGDKGGAYKMWGEGPRKDTRVRDMVPRLEAHGWVKKGRKWIKPFSRELINRGAPSPGYEPEYTAQDAYAQCFEPQRAEYLGKVIRWYYGTNSPGPIVYATQNKTVGNSQGATPCMTLPDDFPADIDYAWYVTKAESMLRDLGVDAGK